MRQPAGMVSAAAADGTGWLTRGEFSEGMSLAVNFLQKFFSLDRPWSHRPNSDILHRNAPTLHRLSHYSFVLRSSIPIRGSAELPRRWPFVFHFRSCPARVGSEADSASLTVSRAPLPLPVHLSGEWRHTSHISRSATELSSPELLFTLKAIKHQSQHNTLFLSFPLTDNRPIT